jgi:transcriptional regulator with XRE-family HTH domain
LAPRHALRQRREQQGLTQEGAAFDLRVAVSTYRSWERGEKTPRVGYRPRLARLLGVTLAEIDAYLDGNGTPPPNGHVVPRWLGHYASLEQGAAAVHTFEPLIVPGLLQTRDYATAVERAGHRTSSDREISQRVAARIARQCVLDREPEPLDVDAVVDESVLQRVTGGRDVMAEQLDHLAGMAQRPNVTVRVLPFDGRVHCAAWGAFQLITAPGAAAPFMACTEDLAGIRYHEAPYAVEAHATLYEHLVAIALDPPTSLDRIRSVAKEVHVG